MPVSRPYSTLLIMKKYIAICLLTSLCCVSVFAQKKETRNTGAFSSIEFRIHGKLYLTQGSPQKVEVEASKDVLSMIKTDVEGGTLEIEVTSKMRNFKSDEEIIVYVTAEKIENINVTGSGDVIAQTKIKSEMLALKVSGSGSLQAEIEVANNLEAHLSGSGKMELKGTCKNIDSHVSGSGKVKLDATIVENANFNISGSGKIEATGTASSVKTSISGSGKVLAADLETNSCDVRLSGSGGVEINVKSSLDANITGSGSVHYKGNPNHVNSNATGSGKISKL